MRLALLSDVHADPAALETALDHAHRLGCSKVLCAGDIVAYGDKPARAIALLQQHDVTCVRGNHDRWALDQRDELPASMLSYLEQLPPRLKLRLEGVSIGICHGTPASDMNKFFPDDATPGRVRQLLVEMNADVLVLGHTHVPMRVELEGRVIVNPGAVSPLSLGGGWLCDPAAGTFKPLEGERGTFGVLELPSLEFKVYRLSDGAEIEIARRQL